MKTQIIQLEVHDDVVSILDKIGWAQTERVLLILPRRRRVLHSKLDLLRLKRQSQKRGSQLALVTDDPLIEALAGEIQISTFRSIQKAHQAKWQTEPYQQNPAALRSVHEKLSLTDQLEAIQEVRSEDVAKTLPIWARILWFLLGIFAVSSVLAVLTPSATIYITPPTKHQSMIISMIASEKIEQVRISGEVPISIRRIHVNGSKTIKVNGTTTIPMDIAEGEVILTNLTNQPIEVPLGTIVRTLDQKPRRYATQQTILLKTGSEKSATVPVQALTAGESQNAQPFEIKSVEGSLGMKLSVENPQAIQGGSSMIAPAPSEDDHRLLLDQLHAELLAKAKEKIAQELQEGDLLLPDSAIKTRIVHQEFSPNEQIATNFLSLNLSLEVTFGLITRQSLADLLNQVLDSTLPSGYIPLEDTFAAACQEPLFLTQNNEYTCKLELSRQIQPSIDRDQIRSLVLGKSLAIASQTLQQTYALPMPPVIETFPRWLPFLPWLPLRIDVIIR